MRGAHKTGARLENHSTGSRPSAMIGPMFRYAFLAAQSAVADAPKAAVIPFFLAAAANTAAAAAVDAAVFTAAAAPIGGARS